MSTKVLHRCPHRACQWLCMTVYVHSVGPTCIRAKKKIIIFMGKTYFCKPAMFLSYNYRHMHCSISRTIALNSRVLLGKLLVPQLLKKFTAHYGTRSFITAFTTAHQFFVSLTTQIQFKSFHPISLLSIRIWFSHLLLCLPSYLLASSFPSTSCIYFSPSLHVQHAQYVSSFLIWSAYLLKITKYYAPRYTVSSDLLPLPPS
jgi:hypothetical protein